MLVPGFSKNPNLGTSNVFYPYYRLFPHPLHREFWGIGTPFLGLINVTRLYRLQGKYSWKIGKCHWFSEWDLCIE
jgi:hypothetical protein